MVKNKLPVSVKQKKDKKRIGVSKGTSKVVSRRKSSHLTWEFKPKLENMSAVLHNIDQSVSIDDYRQWIDHQRGEIQSLIRSNGYTEGAKRINLVRDYTLQLVEGRKPENPGWLATSKVYGVPSCLHEGFIQYIVDYLKKVQNDGEHPSGEPYQVIQTIMNIHRLFSGLVDTKFNSVLEKSRNIDPEFLLEFEDFVIKVIQDSKDSGILKPFETNEESFEESVLKISKNGPNGLPKVETSHCEAIKLRESTLWQPFSWISKLTGQEYLVSYVERLAITPIPVNRKEYDIPNDRIKLRKIASVPDKGFKTRLVAICDFWTQVCLLPIRKYVQSVTESIFGKYDFRKSQEDGINAMISTQRSCLNNESYCGLTLKPEMLKAYDISSWTDRFHRDLQKIVMRNLFNASVSERWAQLTVHCEWYSPDLGGYIKYGQGQGMGTNGSFDIATLTDHLFIHFMYEKEYKDIGLKPLYGKVGDDLWILDPKNVYPDYCEKINLPINLSKSKMFCQLGSVMEFCSRTAINGYDYSRISPSVVNRSSDFREIPNLLSVLNERNVQISPSSITSLNRRVKNSDETYLDKLQPWLLSAVSGNFFLTKIGKKRSPYRFLTADYLVKNDWICNDQIFDNIMDQECLMRLAIIQSILSILESQKIIQDKVQVLQQAKTKVSYDEFKDIYNTSLFTTDTDQVKFIRERIFSDEDLVASKEGNLPGILLPMEIIPLKRLKSLEDALTVKLLEAHDLEGDKIDDIIEFAKRLNSIAVTVDFEGVNLCYDSRRAYNASFKVVKYLERTSSPYDVLVLETQEDKEIIDSILSYDNLPVEWVGKYLPTLLVE